MGYVEIRMGERNGAHYAAPRPRARSASRPECSRGRWRHPVRARGEFRVDDRFDQLLGYVERPIYLRHGAPRLPPTSAPSCRIFRYSPPALPLQFKGARLFNGDISKWDVSKVGYQGLQNMFYDACRFNADIGTWDVARSLSFDSTVGPPSPPPAH